VGRALLLDGIPVTVIGVAPPDFTGLDVGQPFDAMLPLNAERIVRGSASSLDEPMSFLKVVVVLRPGQSLHEATTTLRHIQREIPGHVDGDNAPFAALPAGTGVSELREPYGQPLITLLALVGIILLMASANVACLLLARGSSRQQELTVRLALGAARGRIVRQLLVEGAILSAAGGGAGLALAAWGSHVLAAQISADFGGMALEPVLDWRVLGFAGVAAAVATLVSAVLPAYRSTSRAGSISPALAPGDGGRTPRVARLSSAFVVAQIAMSLVLIVAAGLLVRTFERLSTAPLGFDPGRVLIVNVDNPHAQQAIPLATRLEQLVAAAASVPGVASAGSAFVTPVSGVAMIGHIAPPRDSPSGDGKVFLNVATPGWLAASGIPLISGRDFGPADTRRSQPVALVNEALARLQFPGQDALGRLVRLGKTEERIVIGVVADAVYGSPREGVVPVLLIPASQGHAEPPPWGVSLTIRSAGPPPLDLVKSVAAALSQHDATLTFSFQPLAEHVRASFGRERLIAAVSALFGGLALLLAVVGLYGVTAYAVAQRDLEISIRTALGARPVDVMRLVMGRTLVATTAGIGLGLIAAAGLSRFLQSLLFGVGPFDLATFATVPLVLVVIATAAAFVPARRALTSNLQALRRG
jgi:putative ABC transport system permease protein